MLRLQGFHLGPQTGHFGGQAGQGETFGLPDSILHIAILGFVE